MLVETAVEHFGLSAAASSGVPPTSDPDGADKATRMALELLKNVPPSERTEAVLDSLGFSNQPDGSSGEATGKTKGRKPNPEGLASEANLKVVAKGGSQLSKSRKASREDDSTSALPAPAGEHSQRTEDFRLAQLARSERLRTLYQFLCLGIPLPENPVAMSLPYLYRSVFEPCIACPDNLI